MAIATSPTREKYPLSENKIVKKTLTSVIGLIVILLSLLFTIGGGIIAVVAEANPDPSALLSSLVFIIFAFFF